MITAAITVTDPAATALYQAAVPELMNTERTTISARHEKETDAVVFTLSSKDTTAFRAATNGLIHIITVFEKMKQVSHG